jgi:hypothetical protein
MLYPRIDTRWSLLGSRAVVLENAFVRVVVLPELGARIQSIVYKPSDRELLWQNPRIPPRSVPFGSAYDDCWSGGWDDIFPNDAPATILSERYPDHGELWVSAWTWSTAYEGERAWVDLKATGPISGVEFEKRISLGAIDAEVCVEYVVRNSTGAAFPFMWKLHPALAVTSGHRIDLPESTEVEIEPAFLGSLTGANKRSRWPHAEVGNRRIDLSVVAPATSRQIYLVYGVGYQEGWCAVTDPEANLSYGLVFPSEVFTSCWLFATYGGWRNYHVAVLEPSTAYPVSVEQAIERGTVRVIDAGETLTVRVRFRVQRGLSRVRGLTEQGDFRE